MVNFTDRLSIEQYRHQNVLKQTFVCLPGPRYTISQTTGGG